MRQRTRNLLLAFLLVALAGCPRGTPPTHTTVASTESSRTDPARIEAAGLHNVYRLTDKLYSGSSPEGDKGFASLQKTGIKTILSVDGARPDLELAHKHGMRYVHLPFSYDGIPEAQALRIARAVHDLPGPIYIHCHHGTARGPTAAAVARLCLDDKCSVATVVAEMRRAGTDPHYKGLYATPEKFRRPTPAELQRVPAEFPELAPVAALTEFMAEIDRRWDHLNVVRAAGWKVPPENPDLDPPHEALQLLEQYREAGRLPAVRQRPEELGHWLAEAESAATELEKALRAENVDRPGAEQAFQKIKAACTRCHAKYRDLPRDG